MSASASAEWLKLADAMAKLRVEPTPLPIRARHARTEGVWVRSGVAARFQASAPAAFCIIIVKQSARSGWIKPKS